MLMTVAVQHGAVVQCPTCMRLMSANGDIAAKAEALIKGALHSMCPDCLGRIAEPGSAVKPPRRN